jgi:hypothetical protein
MQIVMTEGRFTLVPIDGAKEGTRAGYYFQFTDSNGIQMVAPLPYDQSKTLAEAILADIEAHPRGDAAPDIQIAASVPPSAEVLRAAAQQQQREG